MTAVQVRLDDLVHARLRAEAHRRACTVPTLLARLAEGAAAGLPDPVRPPRRSLTEVLFERVAAYRRVGYAPEEIAAHLGVTVERVQCVIDELEGAS